MHLRLLHAVKN